MSDAHGLLLLAYLVVLLPLMGLACHRLWLAVAARRVPYAHRGAADPGDAVPSLLVQIPLFNEPFVAERVIDAVCQLRYPRSKLSVQILDDSTDDTTKLVKHTVAAWQQRGVAIEHLHRAHREGFKAGALASGLSRSSAELVAIFDADFVPPADFLLRLVGEFSVPDVGMVQARWGHINRDDSALTAAQAILLDGHFVNEHGGRYARGCFFNFNGTAGIWRRACIESAGGWSGQTLTEDLDLSYRAQLQGWRFVYRPDVVVPAELPRDMLSFKAQQHRWAKGAIETGRLLLCEVWRAPLRVSQRLEAMFHLLGNAAYPLVLLLALLLPWTARVPRDGVWGGMLPLIDTWVFLGASGSLILAYGLAVWAAGAPGRALLYLPHVLALGVGLAVNNSWALWQGLRGVPSVFVRTPKSAETHWVRRDPQGSSGWATAYVEAALAVYTGAGAVLAVAEGRISAAPMLILFCVGFMWAAAGALRGRLPSAPGRAPRDAVRSSRLRVS